MSSASTLTRRQLLFGARGHAPARGEAAPAPATGRPGTPRFAFITAAQCLNAQGVVCASCADACAQRAIHIPLAGRSAIRVDADQCTGCAECISVCPTQAIALQARQEALA